MKDKTNEELLTELEKTFAWMAIKTEQNAHDDGTVETEHVIAHVQKECGSSWFVNQHEAEEEDRYAQYVEQLAA